MVLHYWVPPNVPLCITWTICDRCQVYAPQGYKIATGQVSEDEFRRISDKYGEFTEYTVFKTHWNWGYTCKIRKIWNIELYGWFFRLVEGCPGVATHFFPMNLKYKLLNNCTESEIVESHKRIADIIHQQLNKNTMNLMTRKHFVY